MKLEPLLKWQHIEWKENNCKSCIQYGANNQNMLRTHIYIQLNSKKSNNWVKKWAEDWNRHFSKDFRWPEGT